MKMILVIGKKAFSFVELLVASAILAIGIISILQALSFTSRVAGLTLDIVDALFLCENKMQEWEFKEKQGLIEQQPKQESGTWQGKFNWQSALNLNPDLKLKLYYLDFNLMWKRANREEEITLDTYLRQR